MSSNPYASPESDVSSHVNTAVENTSIWTKRGRLSVLSYWGHSLALVIVGYALMALAFFAATMLVGGETSLDQMLNPESMNPLVFIPVGIVFIAMFWIGTCQAIKRFHDLNLNGWWILTIFIIIGAIALFVPGKETPNRFGGWRHTRLWEKILGIIYLLLLILYFAAPFIGLGALGGFGELSAGS